MAVYLHISTGLRGCYMPDSSYVARFTTRKDLKAAIEGEAESWRDAGAQGLSKAAVTAFAAHLWRQAQRPKHLRPVLPFCLPIKPAGSSGHSSGIFASFATRADYLAFQAQED